MAVGMVTDDKIETQVEGIANLLKPIKRFHALFRALEFNKFSLFRIYIKII